MIETEVDFGEQVENTMGEYGDMYGSQMAPVANVTAITHRECPMFHSIMAGAGAEHNALGMHILCGVEPELEQNLKALMPDLEAYFHYRNLDVSTLKILAQRWAPGVAAGYAKESSHRALDDIRDSIAELAWYRESFITVPD